MAIGVNAGDELHGYVIRITARHIAPPRLSDDERSGTHRRMFTVARDTVKCKIEQPARWVVEKKPEPKK